MSNTANWPLAVSGTKACQTISGLVKTRGHLIMLRHAIGWNLRVCLLWLTGVDDVTSMMTRRITFYYLLIINTLNTNVTMLARAWQSAATLFFLSHTHKHKHAQSVYNNTHTQTSRPHTRTLKDTNMIKHFLLQIWGLFASYDSTLFGWFRWYICDLKWRIK